LSNYVYRVLDKYCVNFKTHKHMDVQYHTNIWPQRLQSRFEWCLFNTSSWWS